MYKQRHYKQYNQSYFAKSENFYTFYELILQKVKKDWNRIGNDILGLSDSKVSRLFSGKQKDFDTLLIMAEFMHINFEFKMY